MHDFKDMHPSNRPAKPVDRLTTGEAILINIGASALLMAGIYWLMWYGLMQATGGVS